MCGTAGELPNHQAMEADRLPGSLIVLGGGAVGLELGQVFARFGVTVAVVEALDRLLPLEEPEAGRTIAEVLSREGVEVHTGVRATEVSRDGGQIGVSLDDGRTLAAERLLVATGRRTNLEGLGIERSASTPARGGSAPTREPRTASGPSGT